MIEARIIVEGRVQGVFFRATTREYANQLHLTGTVKNLSNGTVEIYVQGAKETIEQLIARLKEDSGSANIENLTVTYFSPVCAFEQFHIIY